MRADIITTAATIWILMLIPVAAVNADTSEDVYRLMQSGGHVLMLRHAIAPGSGDPENFKLGDCSTQRNLDARGRSQALDIGKQLQANGVRSATVYSSQWCRCVETAQALGLGPVTELPSLNSFYERSQDREPNINALRSFLSKQSADGELVILVTHFVTIAAITGEGVGSGEGVVLRLGPDGDFQVVEALSF